MDPRHPEVIVPRLKELIKQYERVQSDFEKATAFSQLAPLEMEGIGVTREITLIAPRLHDYIIKISRDNRQRIINTPAKQPQQPTVYCELPTTRKKKAKKAKK